MTYIWDYYNIPYILTNKESENMNAMQNASNDAQNKINRQLIDYNSTQNDLIFKTRKRLFKLEHNFRLLIAGISIIIITTGLMGLVVSYG